MLYSTILEFSASNYIHYASLNYGVERKKTFNFSMLSGVGALKLNKWLGSAKLNV